MDELNVYTGYSTTKQARVTLYPDHISFYKALKLECIAQILFKFLHTLQYKYEKRRSVFPYS